MQCGCSHPGLLLTSGADAVLLTSGADVVLLFTFGANAVLRLASGSDALRLLTSGANVSWGLSKLLETVSNGGTMSCIGHMLQSLEGGGCKDSVGGVMSHGSVAS